MRQLLTIIVLFLLVNLAFGEETPSKVSESSLELNSYQKRNHSFGFKYKKVTMSEAKLFKASSISSDALVTYGTDSLGDVEMNGIELSYIYRWNYEGNWKTSTELMFTTSLDEPDLPTYEASNYYFELFGLYAEAAIAQRVGYIFEFSGKQLELYGSLGIGYANFKLVENWKQVEGSSGDQVDLKSYARSMITKVSLGADYRWNPKWGLSLSAQYTNLKTDNFHTDMYGYWGGSKVTGENDTALDKETTGNFSSLSVTLGMLYSF